MKNKFINILIIFIAIIIILLNFLYSMKDVYNNKEYLGNIFNKYDMSDTDLVEVDNNEFIQEIFSNENNLNQINIFFRISDVTNGTFDKYLTVNLEFELFDETGNSIEKYKFEKVFLEDYNLYIPFRFEPIKDSNQKIYYLHIRSFLPENDLWFELAKSNETFGNRLTINGIESNSSVMYLNNYKNYEKPLYYYIIPLIILVSIIFLLFYLTKCRLIERKYLLISSIVGILLAIIIPVYHGHDELAHFARIYSISNGNIIIESNGKWPEITIPNKYIFADSNRFYKISDIIDTNNKEYNPEELTNYDMQYSSVYSPLSYFPQIIVFKIFSLFVQNPSILLLITRVFQLIFCIYIIYNSIKITPFAKPIFMLVGLLPSTLQTMCLVSADGILISFFMLFMAKILELSYTNKVITNQDYLVLSICSIFVAITKLVYLPLCLIIMFIALNRYGRDIKKNLIIIICISFLITLIWNIFATSNLISGQGVNSIYYIKYYLKKPIELIQITSSTFFKIIGRLFSDMFGGVNDWNGTVIQDGGIVPTIFYLIFIIYIYKGENKIIVRDKKLLSIILVITYLIISTVLHITCTPVNYKDIIGIQGRYFIPFLICIYLIFCKGKSDRIDINKSSYLIILLYLYYCLQMFSNFEIMLSKFY